MSPHARPPHSSEFSSGSLPVGAPSRPRATRSSGKERRAVDRKGRRLRGVAHRGSARRVGTFSTEEQGIYRFGPAIPSAVEDGRESPPPGPTAEGPLSAEQLDAIQRCWQAANYLTIGQIYLQDNPLLRELVEAGHIKPRLLGPGLIDVMLPKRGIVARIYLPTGANSLLSVADHRPRSRDYLNPIVIDKQPQIQWLSMDAAIEHVAGAPIWGWASNVPDGGQPGVVLGCAGDIPTQETVAAHSLRKNAPELKVRVVNVADLMAPLEEL